MLIILSGQWSLKRVSWIHIWLWIWWCLQLMIWIFFKKNFYFLNGSKIFDKSKLIILSDQWSLKRVSWIHIRLFREIFMMFENHSWCLQRGNRTRFPPSVSQSCPSPSPPLPSLPPSPTLVGAQVHALNFARARIFRRRTLRRMTVCRKKKC